MLLFFYIVNTFIVPLPRRLQQIPMSSHYAYLGGNVRDILNMEARFNIMRHMKRGVLTVKNICLNGIHHRWYQVYCSNQQQVHSVNTQNGDPNWFSKNLIW